MPSSFNSLLVVFSGIGTVIFKLLAAKSPEFVTLTVYSISSSDNIVAPFSTFALILASIFGPCPVVAPTFAVSCLSSTVPSSKLFE